MNETSNSTENITIEENKTDMTNIADSNQTSAKIKIDATSNKLTSKDKINSNIDKNESGPQDKKSKDLNFILNKETGYSIYLLLAIFCIFAIYLIYRV